MRGKTAIDPAWRFVHEDETPMPVEEYPVNQVLATHQPLTNLTLGILRADRDGLTWVQCNAHQDWDIDGNLLRVVVTFADVTDRKQSEAALRQNHAMLDTILNAIPQSVFWKDRDCRYLGCNARFAEAVGLQSPRDIVGKTDFDLPWPREEAEAYRADDRQVMAHHSLKTHIIEPLQQADGSRLWIDTTKIPLLDAQGRVHGVLGVFDDITARKQVEEKLRDSEERFKQVSRVISDFAYSCRKREGQDYRIDWLTGAVERISGYSAEEILAAGCWQFLVLTEDQSLFLQGVRGLMPGQSATREFRIRHKDGTVRWLLSSAQCLTYSDDPADHLIYGGCLDITERKQVEEERRKTENRLKEAERLAHLGSWELDLATQVLTWSDETYRLFEIDPATCGASYEEFLNAIHPEDRDAVEQAYSSSLETRTDYDIDHRLLMPDGRVKYVHEHGTTVYDATGRALRSVGTVQDITERQRIEAELQRKLTELQQWYEVMLGREERVLELKHEADSLRKRLGEPPRFAMELADDLPADLTEMLAAETGAGDATATLPMADPPP
jgi:PAS domain S-box-containing protein